MTSFHFDSLYLTDNATLSTSNLTASEWAEQQWLPAMFLSIVVVMLSQFIIAYEHVLHAPKEWYIWSRILRRKKLTKAILPWSTLWLRYTTLALGIVSIVFMWDNAQSAATCIHHIIPLVMAFCCIVSCSTGCVAAWRSGTIAKAALTSTLSVTIVKLVLFLCVLVRLSSQIVAFGMQIKVTNAINDSLLSQGAFKRTHLSCFASTLLIMEQSDERGLSILKPAFACIGLLAICFVTDMIYAAITFVSIAKLSKSVNTQNSLLSELLHNSIMFYGLLLIVHLFSLIFYSITRQYNVVILMITGASILMIRILVKEQECITAHSQSDNTNYTKTPWFTITRDRERPTNNRNQQNVSQPGVIPASKAVFSLPSPSKAKPIVGGGAQAGRGGGGACPGCRHTAKGLRRRGAGLTDIEKVSVLENGRSVDRPWPMWDDDEEEDELIMKKDYDPIHDSNLSHHGGGIRSLVANWTRGVEAAISCSEKEQEEEDIQEAYPACKSPRVKGATKETDSITTADDSNSVLNSNQQLTAIPSLNRLSCPPPARLSRSRSSSIQKGLQKRFERSGLTKTMF